MVNDPKPDPQGTGQPAVDGNTEEMVDVVLGHALGLGFYNALQTQQNHRIMQSSITMAACKRILDATPAQLKNLTDPEEGLKDAQQHVRAQIQEIAKAASGGGKVQIAVSQSAVIAVQDAIDHLRNLNTISSATIGRAMAGMVQTGDMQYKEMIHQAEDMVARAAEQLNSITRDAVELARAFSDEEQTP
ncbi:MAG: RebB family R body protein [Acidobacteriota bacterium]|nr:RebB family R body protein [Acidobacteriota bacterium]